ncbi:FecR family protein [Chitinophaga rhizosphaerae]|uniref:FecR family protein n=1 Tax=Chitinophaga rhizosphaerae TaxID=1864947 RepID=UPI0013E04622|nr:FecR domain-containing protein [Chitinophaga rhizosphaerae]
MKNTRLHNLVQDFLDNKLDAAGQREFYTLLGDAGQREALAEVFLERMGPVEAGTETDPALQGILGSVLAADSPMKTPVRRMRYLGWAAAIGLLVLAGSVYRLTEQHRNVSVPVAQAPAKVHPPGRQGAVLTLADGSTILLDSLQNGIVASQSGAEVVLDNGQLTYDADETNAASPAFNTIATPKGRQFRVVLPDGTKVWLNAASSLQYPVVFTENAREVKITGEAYFEVTADPLKPFSVRFGEKGLVEVLGTEFNINTYTDEPAVKASLLRGSIRVNKQQVLRPGEQAIIDADGGMTVTSGSETANAIDWKNGLFTMSSTELPALFRQISRWYDIEVEIHGELPRRSFGGTLDRSVNLTDLIEALNIYGVNCSLEKNKLIVRP